MAESKTNEVPKQQGEIDQLIDDWGGFSVYDNPLEAYRLGTILSPCQLDRDKWTEWKREHYVGDSGYDHDTGKIINEKQRDFFDRYYPNWEKAEHYYLEDDSDTYSDDDGCVWAITMM